MEIVKVSRKNFKEIIIHINKFLGKKTNWESWSENFLAHGKCKEYEKLLVSSASVGGVDKIPMQDECEIALEGDMDLDKIIK